MALDFAGSFNAALTVEDALVTYCDIETLFCSRGDLVACNVSFRWWYRLCEFVEGGGFKLSGRDDV